MGRFETIKLEGAKIEGNSEKLHASVERLKQLLEEQEADAA